VDPTCKRDKRAGTWGGIVSKREIEWRKGGEREGENPNWPKPEESQTSL
jgi:hypothetical protein